MKVEMTHTVKHEGLIYTKGDIVTSEKGAYFCACGWARDLSGKTPTAAPQEAVVLDVKSATHSSKVT